MKNTWSYNPQIYYESNIKLRRALDALRDHTFAQNENEHNAFCNIFYKLLEGRPKLEAG